MDKKRKFIIWAVLAALLVVALLVIFAVPHTVLGLLQAKNTAVTNVTIERMTADDWGSVTISDPESIEKLCALLGAAKFFFMDAYNGIPVGDALYTVHVGGGQGLVGTFSMNGNGRLYGPGHKKYTAHGEEANALYSLLEELYAANTAPSA